jgi:F-type H+-transporting ATPase subunit delta
MAGRYATALFELARESNAIDAVSADLNTFELMLAASPDLLRLVRSPVFTAEEQGKAIDAILARAHLGGLAVQFLKVVAANRRLFAVREIIAAYKAMVARDKGEVTAQVTSAEPLNEARLAEIRDALRTVTGKTVVIDAKVDAAIIGGLIVKVGSRMVDSSLRTKLNAIKHAMNEAG